MRRDARHVLVGTATSTGLLGKIATAYFEFQVVPDIWRIWSRAHRCTPADTNVPRSGAIYGTDLQRRYTHDTPMLGIKNKNGVYR
jgi:hypothetical protein